MNKRLIFNSFAFTILLLVPLIYFQHLAPWNQIDFKQFASTASAQSNGPILQEFSIPSGSGPHDVAPAPDGTVWYTAQLTGELGRFNPSSGETEHIDLGNNSAPHGVIIGPDGAPWITASGLNAIVRVDPETHEVRFFPLPVDIDNVNLNTATFDQNGTLWFTGLEGFYGRLNQEDSPLGSSPENSQIEVFDAPRGKGPYGMTTTPDGQVYYASLHGNHIARIDLDTGESTVLEPPTKEQGARRVWSDSQGRIWVSEYNAGQVALYDPTTQEWKEWRLPGSNPKPYAVYVDEHDIVWLSDFGANAIIRFDPTQETFNTFSLPSPEANVRQILGRTGEVWGAESGVDKLMVIRTGN